MKLRNSISSNIGWLAAANIFAKPVWFLFFIIVARMLGPEEYGKFMYALSFVSIVSVFFESGIDYQVVRVISQETEGFIKYISHSLCVKVISGILVAATTSILLVSLTQTPEIKYLIALAVLYLNFNYLTYHIRFIFRGFEVMKYEGISIIFEKVLIVAIGGIALAVGAKALGFMESYVIAYLILFGLTFRMLVMKVGRPRLSIDFHYLFNVVIKPALPYAFMGFFMMIYFRSATILIEMLTHSQQFVGFYNSGYRVVESFALFPSIIITPMYPVFSRRSDDKIYIRSLLKDAVRIILVMSTIIAVPCCLFATEVTSMLYGESYLGATRCFSIIVLTIVPMGFTWTYGTLVAAVGRQTKANYFIVIITVANLLLHYLFIPRFGVNGAAAVTLVTECAIATMNIYIVRDYVQWSYVIRLIGQVLIIVAILTISVQVNLFRGPILVKILQSLTMIMIGYYSFHIITIDDIKKIMRWKR
jgi:O-antigen/teichoic acid export membrane protein